MNHPIPAMPSPPEPERLAVVTEHLYGIASALQLPSAPRALAERIYHDIGRFLQQEAPSFAHAPATLYPQGSILHGTTCHPLYRDRFDLDCVYELATDYGKLRPIALLDSMQRDLVAWQLKHGPQFAAQPPERKQRCVALHFTDQIFNLDVVPAGMDTAKTGTHIQIPDRQLKGWKSTNPKGLGGWFDSRCALQFMMIKAGRIQAGVEPIKPDQHALEKAVLKLVVQLAKRARDRFHGVDSTLITPSVVMTVVIARSYLGIQDLTLALLQASEDLRTMAQFATPPIITNPANADEVISEKWRDVPGAWAAFQKFASDFSERVRAIVVAKDLTTLRGLLKSTFGDKEVNEAIRRQSRAVDHAHQNGQLAITPAGRVAKAPTLASVMSMSAVPAVSRISVPPTTYHGDGHVG